MTRYRRRRRARARNPLTPLLTEVLPFELPASFSNYGFYRLLVASGATFESGALVVPDVSPGMRLFLCVISGENPARDDRDGLKRYRVALSRVTAPIEFRVSHERHGYRLLSLPHPLAQLAAAEFYETLGESLLIQLKRPSFSVRSPARRTSRVVMRDSIFRAFRDEERHAVESVDREHALLASYFAYSGYRFIHRLYTSQRLARLQERYGEMRTLDIARFFDNIYTHSAGWATHSRRAVKGSIRKYGGTLGGRFDSLMQNMGEGETRGIVIGPEVSRIFAEVILQSVDREVIARLETDGIRRGTDYEVLRYVDDYFVFSSSSEIGNSVQSAVQRSIEDHHFYLNEEKTQIFDTPVVSRISVARSRIERVVEAAIEVKLEADSASNPPKFEWRIDADLIAEEFHAVIADSADGAEAVASFTISQIEFAVDRVLRASFEALSQGNQDPLGNARTFVQSISRLRSLMFHAYGFAPRVASAVKIVRTSSQAQQALKLLGVPAHLLMWFDESTFRDASTYLRRSPLRKDSSVEGLYLLALLAETCDADVKPDEILPLLGLSPTMPVTVPEWFHPLAIFELMRFSATRPAFAEVHAALEHECVLRVSRRVPENRRDAEAAFLALGILNSPHTTLLAKRRVARVFCPQATNEDVDALGPAAGTIFVEWGAIDLYDRLLEKSVREVY